MLNLALMCITLALICSTLARMIQLRYLTRRSIYYMIMNERGEYYYTSVGWRNTDLRPYYLVSNKDEIGSRAASLRHYGTPCTVHTVTLLVHL